MIHDDDEIDHIEGWVQAEDVETGGIYYTNIFSNERSNEKPEAVKKHEEKLKQESKKQTRRLTNLSQWIETTDPETGAVSYFNPVTRETRSEKPANLVDQVASLTKKPEEKKAEKGEIVFNQSSFKFLEKSLTVVQDVKKETCRVESFSDINSTPKGFTFHNAPPSEDLKLDLETFPKDFLEKVRAQNFAKFCEDYLPKRTSWGKAVPTDKILTFQNKPLSKSITNLSKEVSGVSIQTFKNILSYTGERKSSKNEIRHAQKLLGLAMNSPGELKDEIYFQLIKQLHENPSLDKTIRVWKLFCVMSSAIPPGPNLYYPLMNFLYGKTLEKNLDENLKSYAKFCFQRIYQTVYTGVRSEPLTMEEIMFVEATKQIIIPFYFLNGRQNFLGVESYTTMGEVKRLIFEMLDINKQRMAYFSLYETVEKSSIMEERYVEDDEKVMDLLSIWEMERNLSKGKEEKPDCRLCLKAKVIYPMKDDDKDTVAIYYTQMVHMVVSSRLDLTEENVLMLAALQMQNDFGDYSDSHKKTIIAKLADYIPHLVYDSKTPEQWMDKIAAFHKKYQGYQKHDAKLSYLEILQDNPLHLAEQFFVRYQKQAKERDWGIPEKTNLILGIKPDGISLCDALTKGKLKDSKGEIVGIYDLKTILTWGVSGDCFVFVLGTEDKHDKLYLETPQGKSIEFLIQAYINIALGKSFRQAEKEFKPAQVVKIERHFNVFPKRIKK